MTVRKHSRIAHSRIATLAVIVGMATSAAIAAAAEFPLLGSSRGGHRWFDFCEGKPDGALLPAEPRSLVQPGVSDGRAVHFNTWWKNCHADPELVGEHAQPKTCGELRAFWTRGKILMRGNGTVGEGTFFAGTTATRGVSAQTFNELWRAWGLPERPDNFDLLVAQRYGLPMGAERNPYPLAGEDPNQTNGGSGQLAAAMTQLRKADGSWTGELSFKCHLCHSGQVGEPEEGEGLGLLYGSGTGLHDIALFWRELGALGVPGGQAGIAFSLFGTSRGTNNAQFGNITGFPYPQDLARRPTQGAGWLQSGSTASMDTPAWWNVGHRPVKFADGILPADAVRVDMAFYLLDGNHGQDADYWLLSTKAPKYPLAIDRALAEKGAIVFHAKNLWGEGLDNPVPKPKGGNGSCASCHGAYSPRFVNDRTYLADPVLEGVASNVVPIRIIGTDTARLDAMNEDVQQSNGGAWAGYPETTNRTDVPDCGSQNREELRGDREPGYLAPPLYGVWATAPYFHNGSLPDVWSVLKAEDRPKIWRRRSTPAPLDQAGSVVMGYDTSVARAYDGEKLGWKYDEITCGEGTLPVVECDPLNPGAEDPLAQQALAEIYGNALLTWNAGQAPVYTQWTPGQIEDRKIYNTHLFSQGNEGHEFTSVLTDAERRALIEYLKTL
ncbi:MAG: endo-cleaving rubber dioxygenase [Candidatus Binatota bacterium]|nr:endo-cleaving rubber dioxygenase [Candidatus Binatota bacterium]